MVGNRCDRRSDGRCDPGARGHGLRPGCRGRSRSGLLHHSSGAGAVCVVRFVAATRRRHQRCDRGPVGDDCRLDRRGRYRGVHRLLGSVGHVRGCHRRALWGAQTGTARPVLLRIGAHGLRVRPGPGHLDQASAQDPGNRVGGGQLLRAAVAHPETSGRCRSSGLPSSVSARSS